MSTFGLLKTKLEESSIQSYKNNEFDKFMSTFKKLVLENKDICELYYIYDDLNSNKGLNRDIVDDYINENIEYSKILIKENEDVIDIISNWLKDTVISESNIYSNIDTLIYNDSIKNLETVLECKRQIKNTLMIESKVEKLKESVNLPLSTLTKIYESTLKNKLNLNETELSELVSIKKLTNEEINNEISTLKESVISKLKTTINESKDGELNTKVQDTINKINNSKIDHYNLYKLRKLNEGL